MFSTSSSLAVSESNHELPRSKHTGHIKNSLFRHSKQDLTEMKMFKGKKSKMGAKKFGLNKREKGFSKAEHPSYSEGEYHTHGVGPSPEEFDKMLHASVTFNPNKKRSAFSMKKFG